MKKNKAKENGTKESKELALHFMKTLVEVARESFLILDPKLRVISANPTFYQKFQVLPKETEDRFIYDLGNGQWNIPELKRLLEEVLPEKKVVKNYEVEHVFEKIGMKTMLLNARQIDAVQLIILAIEDITEIRQLEQERTKYTKGLEVKIAERTKELAERVRELQAINKSMVGRELKMVKLKKEIENLKKRVKNSLPAGEASNGRNGKRRNGNGNYKNGR